MTRLKQFGVAGLLLALALTVAACGGRNAEATSPAEDPGPAVVERAPAEAPVAAVDAAAAAPVTNVAETDAVPIADAETDAAPIADIAVSDSGSDYAAALFAIEPLGASCCPKPTLDKALEGAQGVAGVIDARLIDDFTVFVRFDPGVTDQSAIASAINQASFLVTEKEATADELAALALTTNDADGESN